MEASFDWSGKQRVGSTKRAEPGKTLVRACARVLQLLIIGPATAGSAGPLPPPLANHSSIKSFGYKLLNILRRTLKNRNTATTCGYGEGRDPSAWGKRRIQRNLEGRKDNLVMKNSSTDTVPPVNNVPMSGGT